jgi:hypothetical protein
VAKASGPGLSLEVDGLTETLKAVQGLDRDLERPAANKQLRGAAGDCARGLSVALVSAASASGVPVAPKVATSIRVKSDRLPSVSIGSGKLAPLLWGSEQGPKSEPNRFAVEPNLGGYWITPTVHRFGEGPALDLYRRAVFEILHGYGLA